MNSKYELWASQMRSVKEKDGDEVCRNWIKKTLESKEHIDIFGRYFFPHIIQGTDDAPECHLDLVAELARPKDSAVIFPRGFAKTTWEKIDTIHDIVYNLEPVILYIAATIGDAQFHFESIKMELENNHGLREVYGNLVPPEWNLSRKWTNKHFETTNGVNLVARGRNKGRGINIKNKRPTKAIADDLEDDEQVRNPEQRLKLHNWLYQVIIPSLDKTRGRLKMIGTVLHPKAEVLEFYHRHGGIFRKAIENGQSIWPTRFTLEDLEAIKLKIGTAAFMQEYMNTPTDAELARIKPEWLTDRTYTELPAGLTSEVIYIDPQAGEKGSADEFAITNLLWYRKDIHRYVTDQWAGRKSQWEQSKDVVRMWLFRGKRARAVGVEKVLNQTAVWQNLLAWKARKVDFNTKDTVIGSKDWIDESDRNIPLVECSPEGKDKVVRLERHEPAIERGEIHVRPEMTELIEQTCFLNTGTLEHDDRVDSMVGALDLSYYGDTDLFALTHQEEYNSDDEDEHDYDDSTFFGNLDNKLF